MGVLVMEIDKINLLGGAGIVQPNHDNVGVQYVEKGRIEVQIKNTHISDIGFGGGAFGGPDGPGGEGAKVGFKCVKVLFRNHLKNDLDLLGSELNVRKKKRIT